MDLSPFANVPIILIIAGLAFIFVSKIKISGKWCIEPLENNTKPIFYMGIILLVLGFFSYVEIPTPNQTPNQIPTQTPTQTSTPPHLHLACKSGYVWRDASGPANGDFVCVTPLERKQAADENAASAVNMRKPGYVERNAFPGDNVWVTPEQMQTAQRQNAEGWQHTT